MADEAAFALFDVGGPPGAVDVVQRDGALVDVGADAHLLGGADEDRELAGAASGEQAGPGFVGAAVVDERDLAGWDAVGGEAAFEFVVGGPGASVVGVDRSQKTIWNPPRWGEGWPASSR